MGIEIIRLGEKQPTVPGQQAGFGPELFLQEYTLLQPEMSISMMFADNSTALFPWWSYGKDLDEDVAILNNIWSVNTPQAFFDCLFFATLRKNFGSNLYAVFPGTVKSQNWAHVQPADRSIYLSGQACIYHLHGDFQKKLSIQWVPFWQPQSVVKDPSFFSLWRLFQQIASEDSIRSLTFFQLNDSAGLPAVINLLNDAEEKRSEKLSELVDWFGMYSSPVQGQSKPGFVSYAKNKEKATKFVELKNQFDTLFHDGYKTLSQNVVPKTVLRFLSGHIAL